MAADLNKIYTSVTLDEAENHLLQFSEKWRKQYPSLSQTQELRKLDKESKLNGDVIDGILSREKRR